MALKLAITQGPRAGETLEFGPRYTVRIGRVVRGNNLQIKDSGISSKHLSIGCESGKWILRDLGSSNGTSVNQEPVDPGATVEIRDGDVVKIGEETSLSVKIEDCDGSRLRRNPRRGVRESAADSVAVENSAEVVGNSRRGRSGRARVLKIVADDEEGDGDLDSEDGEMEEKPVKKANMRRNRSSKKEESVVSGSFLGKIPENSDSEGGEVGVGAGGNVVEQKPVTKVRMRRGQSSKKEESVVSCSVLRNIPENSDLEFGEPGVGAGAGGNAVEQRMVRPASKRQTRSSKNEESVVSDSVLAEIPGISDLEGGEMGVGTGGNAVEQRMVRQASKWLTWSLKNEESLVSGSVPAEIPGISDLEGGEMGVGALGNAVERRPARQASKRQTWSLKNDESAVSGPVFVKIPGISDLEGGEEEVVSRKTGATTSTRKGRKLPQKKPPQWDPIDIPEDSGDNILVDATNTESLSMSNLGEWDQVVTAGDREGNEDCKILENSDEAEKDRGPGSKEKEVGKEIDLEKMTLGQWFDFLEVNLPKQMIEATEEMIKDMRLRAKRVHEYIIQQKNEKAKVPL